MATKGTFREFREEYEKTTGIKPPIFTDPKDEREYFSNIENYGLEFKTKDLVKEATKHDDGKPRHSTIPKMALREITKVFTYGANKYGRFNYSGKMDVSRYTDAAVRHLTAYETGEEIDEIGTHHLANACASLMMALDGILTGQVNDDRNPIYKTK